MITENTVFVLGAGASKPYCYPLGDELGKEIIKDFLPEVSNQWVVNAPGNFYIGQIHVWGNAPMSIAEEKAEEFVRQFKEADMSIDIFLTRKSGDEWISRMGRLAIVLRILAAEKAHLTHEPQNDTQDWYRLLARKLDGGLYNKKDFIDKFKDNRVTIVTFNYDRSLEYYLFNSFYHGFGFDHSDEGELTRQLIDHIRIIHLHGKVAPLPWEATAGQQPLKYGEHLHASEVIARRLLKNIRIAQEEFDDQNEDYKQVQQAMASARTVFFLGFAYAEENLAKLGLSSLYKSAYIYGTAYGMRDPERTRAEKTVERYLRTEPVKEMLRPFKFAGCDDDCMILLRDRLG